MKNLITTTITSIVLFSALALPLKAQTKEQSRRNDDRTHHSLAINVEGLSTLSYLSSKDQFYSFGVEYFITPHLSLDLTFGYSSNKGGSGNYISSNAAYRLNSDVDSNSTTEQLFIGARWYFSPQQESGFFVGLGLGEMNFTSSIKYDVQSLDGSSRDSGTKNQSMTSSVVAAKGGYRFVMNENLSLNLSVINLMPSKPLKQKMDLTIDGVNTNLGSYNFSAPTTGVLGELQITF